MDDYEEYGKTLLIKKKNKNEQHQKKCQTLMNEWRNPMTHIWMNGWMLEWIL